jgi:O-antigen/teichoic acid export membrane protein
VRLIVTSIIGLYSSRLVLQELGVDDFGLYGVVGGIVALMNFLNSSMISTSNRFIAVELGKVENKNVNKVFNTVLIIHVFLALIILVLGELLGSWYVINHLNVNPNKISDALFVLHFSLFTAVLGTILVPYQGLLIAYQKFNVKATVEILQSSLHLLLIVVISFLAVNELRMYAALVFTLSAIIFLVYFIYLRLKFGTEIKWNLNKKKSDYKEVSVFFGWSMFYVIGSSFSKQGGILILNSFFGTALNAAYAIANRVFALVYSFVKNLNQAAIPQIMINFSSGNQEKSLTLIYNLSKFTFFIMYLISFPLLLSINPLLELWLEVVPDYSAVFASLMIIHGLISCLESGFDAAIDSTGKIKKTKIYFNIIMLSTLPVLYLLYYFGLPPFTLTIVMILAEALFLIVQLRILQKLLNLNIHNYIKKTIFPVILVITGTLPQVYLRTLFDQTIIGTVIFSLISVLLTVATILFLGLNSNERNMILVKLISLKQKYHK